MTPARPRPRGGVGLPLALLVSVLACNETEPAVVPSDLGDAGPASSGSGKPVDRLAPGELAPGKSSAFGLLLPRKMKLDAKSARTAHASGRVSPEDLANYVRKRVKVSHVELGAARTIFPRARITGGLPNKEYRIEVVPTRAGFTRLVITDLTRPPATQGISEKERWRRAGLTPDGKPINMKDLE